MKKMTKEEVQKRVLKGGEPLSLNLFDWDAETNTFSSREGNLVDWVWLSVYDIVEILEDEKCSISGHEKFSKEVIQSKTWERLWNE